VLTEQLAGGRADPLAAAATALQAPVVGAQLSSGRQGLALARFADACR
jgi:hypothetical protein